MAGIYEVIQQITANTLNAAKLSNVYVGTVTEDDPLEITISDSLTLPRGNLVLSKGLNLEEDDRVIMIRAEGGQKYYVICEVESDDTTDNG